MYEPFIDPSGPSLGSLLVHMRYESQEGDIVTRPLWSLKNHQGPNWMYGQAMMQNDQDFVVSRLVPLRHPRHSHDAPLHHITTQHTTLQHSTPQHVTPQHDTLRHTTTHYTTPKHITAPHYTTFHTTLHHHITPPYLSSPSLHHYTTHNSSHSHNIPRKSP